MNPSEPCWARRGKNSKAQFLPFATSTLESLLASEVVTNYSVSTPPPSIVVTVHAMDMQQHGLQERHIKISGEWTSPTHCRHACKQYEVIQQGQCKWQSNPRASAEREAGSLRVRKGEHGAGPRLEPAVLYARTLAHMFDCAHTTFAHTPLPAHSRRSESSAGQPGQRMRSICPCSLYSLGGLCASSVHACVGMCSQHMESVRLCLFFLSLSLSVCVCLSLSVSVCFCLCPPVSVCVCVCICQCLSVL